MENTAAPCATARSAPTILDLLVRGGVASAAYLDVERTLARARRMLTPSGGSINPAGPPIAAYRALATRCTAHAQQLFRDHVREVPTRLPAGLTVALPMWDSDHARVTAQLLATYRQQCEGRIAEMVRATSARSAS